MMVKMIKKVVEKNNVPPSQLTKEELEEAISSILRTTHYSSEHGLEMHTLALLFYNVFTKAKIQRINQNSISENCLKS